jgi:hypothetical protein
MLSGELALAPGGKKVLQAIKTVYIVSEPPATQSLSDYGRGFLRRRFR